MRKEPDQKKAFFSELLQPETHLERQILHDPEFIQGLDWGTPRYGHPEGQIYKHIREVLDNVEALPVAGRERENLRLIAFVHDTFKYKEHKGHPRDWSKHHAIFARKFLEKYTNNSELLTITEWHDEAYYCWCTQFLYHQPAQAHQRLQALLDRLDDSLQLYYYFFVSDTRTGDKNLAPLRWFERTVEHVEPVIF